jgi:hypothetical protein
MTDVFGIDSQLGGVFKGTSFAVTLGSVNSTLAGALVQSIQVAYSRSITRVWELGSLNQFYIQGRTEGQGSLQQIVGPAGIVSALLTGMSDICTASGQTMSLSAANNACAGAAGTAVMLDAPVATNFTLGSTVQGFLVDTGLSFTYVSMRQ